MTIRLTPAQAAKLGVGTAARKRTTRKTARGPYHTVCVLCHTQFTTIAGEDRHVNETGHPRYALVIDDEASD